MRHRIGGLHMGFGNPAREKIDGKPTGNDMLDAKINECCKEAFPLFFERFGYVDAQYTATEITIGCEPAYFGEDLKMIVLAVDKGECQLITGHAFGFWGSGIRQKNKRYDEYVKASKFTRFIDKWHPVFFPNQQARLPFPRGGVDHAN